MDTDQPPPAPSRDPSAFGPGGYLPERAAKRARKIVLREQMGRGWPLAALLASVLVAVAGGWYLVSATGAPRPPYVAIADLADLEAGTAGTAGTAGAETRDVLVSRAAGGVQAFAAPGTDVVLCPTSGRLEAPSGQVWTPDGRLVGGDGASLEPLPVRVYDGTVYVDPTSPAPAPEPEPRGETPTC